ncbi:PREDICTED: actin cytoskeleton-regulatory complex protein pan1 [Drosophila arizonae]|uniref:Actin cytoskeleton-regulatory complex protein pan1 n=1 Tax=Drosophila arizonae TaxID=7263 RepID=A0ABM1NKT6_DROAR|nr:PREDICTED: actin cytoskeleton-regulatory complex protein pan1 [Drosophila arizonae]
MNYLIQRGKLRQQAINVPEGLPELLSDITREVLRCQPTKECLCQFIIDYLHSVIVTREKALVAKTILERALRQVDSIISDLCICDLTKEKSDEMAQVMEDCFRNFLEKRRCEMRRGKETIKFADIDMLEELIRKCKFTEEELDASRPAIASAYKRFVDAYMAAGKESQGTELLYQYFRDRELKRLEELMRNKAATTIQAAYRGYLVRRMMDQHVCLCTCMLQDKDDDEFMRLDRAARVIQRFFRYVLSRQAIKPIEDPCQEKETPTDRDDSAEQATAATATSTAVGTAQATAVPSQVEIEGEAAKPDESSPEPAPPGEDAPPPEQAAEAAPAPAPVSEAEPAAAAEPPPPPAEEAAPPPPPAEEPAPPPAAEEAPPAAEEAPPAE